jgi:TolB-like protein
MQKCLLAILFISSLFPKDIIAILELEQKGLSEQEAEILTDRLTTKMISLDKYQVVERNNMDKILKEQKFQNSGCTDSECAVEIGQLLNSDYIIIGSVNKFGDTYAVDARLIDVGLGKSIISAEFSMTGKIDALLTTGITSIAKQLCGIQAATTLQQSAQSSISITPPSLFSKVIQHDLSDKTWTVGVGVATITPNLLEITKDFKISKGTSVFVSAGFPHYAVGLSTQSNYNNTGLSFSASIGASPFTLVTGFVASTLAYQWRFNRLFITLGIGYWDAEQSDGYEEEPIKPVASLDYRF